MTNKKANLMRNNKEILTKNKNKITALLVSSAFMLVVLGCHISSNDDTAPPDEDPVTGPSIISTLTNTFVKPDNNTVTVTFNGTVKAVVGIDLAKKIKVYSDNKVDPDTPNNVTSVVFATSTAGVTDGNQIIITVDTAFDINNKVKVIIPKDTLIDSSGDKNNTTLTSVAFLVVNNLADYNLSYGTTALTTTVGVAKTFSLTTNEIETVPDATYAITLQSGVAVPSTITIDASGSIKVADTIAAGTYKIRVTATTVATGYTGATTVEVILTVSDATVLAGTLEYINITSTLGTALVEVSPIWSVPDQTASYAISPPLEGTGITFSTTTGKIGGTPTTKVAGTEYTVTATGIGKYKGEITSAKFTITVTAKVINLNTFDLRYDTAINATYGTEKTYAVTTTIPAAANATYTIAAKDGITNITGISISGDGATITVANTIAIGTYNLTVTASTTTDGYTGTKTADLTIIVESINLNTFDLRYDTATHATYGTEKTYAVTTTIPAAANATYTIAAKDGITNITGITISGDGATITVAATNAAGTYNLTVTASTTTDGYTGTKTADLTIIVESINLNTFDLRYDTATHATYGTEKTYAVTTTIPAAANAIYAIAAKDGITNIAGIIISGDGASITVAATNAAGTYNLTVTASTTTDGYTGTKTADLTITVDKKNIAGYILEYPTSTLTMFHGQEKTYNVITNSIPKEVKATYAIVLTTDGAEVTGISISGDGAIITVADTTVVGEHQLTITATTGSANYTGEKTANITIKVEPEVDISTFDASYNSGNQIYMYEQSQPAATYAVTTAIPAVANVAYKLEAKSGSQLLGAQYYTFDTTTGTLSINGDSFPAKGIYYADDTIGASTFKVTITPTAIGYSGEKVVEIPFFIQGNEGTDPLPNLIFEAKIVHGTLTWDSLDNISTGTYNSYSLRNHKAAVTGYIVYKEGTTVSTTDYDTKVTLPGFNNPLTYRLTGLKAATKYAILVVVQSAVAGTPVVENPIIITETAKVTKIDKDGNEVTGNGDYACISYTILGVTTTVHQHTIAGSTFMDTGALFDYLERDATHSYTTFKNNIIPALNAGTGHCGITDWAIPGTRDRLRGLPDALVGEFSTYLQNTDARGSLQALYWTNESSGSQFHTVMLMDSVNYTYRNFWYTKATNKLHKIIAMSGTNPVPQSTE